MRADTRSDMRQTKKSRVVDLVRFVTSLLLAVLGAAALAADDAYLVKPIRWILPYPPGSASDLVTRAFSSELRARHSDVPIIFITVSDGFALGVSVISGAQSDYLRSHCQQRAVDGGR